MKQEFTDYLNHIAGITDLYYQKTKKVIEFYENIYPNDIQDIYVSEYMDKEGNRHYLSLWIFTSELCCEAKNFLTEENYDATPIRKRIVHWELIKSDYEFNNTNEKSQMTINVHLDTTIIGTLKSSKDNCNKLKEIFNKYFSNNFSERSTTIQSV